MLVIGAAIVAALVIGQGATSFARRRLGIVGAVAYGVRCLAVLIVYQLAIRTHGEGTWLSDEASFYLAAESLQPNPLLKALPQGLEHLGTDAYLGVLTWMTVVIGHMDTVSYRLANATLGALVALVASIIAARIVGGRAGLIAGLVLALWPTLVLWSATFLRDTLASFIVIVVWWSLVRSERAWNVRTICVPIVGLLIAGGLRPYLAGAMALGILVWAVYPLARRQSPRVLALAAAVLVVAFGVFALQQARHIDQAAHELVYRQTTTRMETLGRLYSDPNPDTPPQEPPFGPGAAVAISQPGTDWILTGLVQDPLGAGLVRVGFVDGSIRQERIADLTLIQSARLVPTQIVASLGPGLVAFLAGSSNDSDSGSFVWALDAFAWDVLLLVAIVGGIRARIPLHTWLFPACVVLGTTAALIAVPGAPGNVDRHRSAQTLPLLVVFASSWWLARRSSAASMGWAVSSANISATSPVAPAASRKRSLR